MNSIQKIILMFYAIGVFFLSVIYKPVVEYHAGGLKKNLGHFLITINLPGYVVFDSPRIFVELIAFTMICTAAILLFKD